MKNRTFNLNLMVLAVAVALTACGGGGGDSNVTTPTVPTAAPQAPATPVATGPVTDVPLPVYSVADKTSVFNQLNDDRARCGFGKLAQNTKLDTAAQAHADYLVLNSLPNSHTENNTLPGFYGTTLVDRFSVAGYPYSAGNEIIASTSFGSIYSTFPQPTAGQMPLPSVTELSAVTALRQLYSSVYHLAGAMSPSKEVGVGVIVKVRQIGGNTAGYKQLVINSGVSSNDSPQTIAQDAVLTFPCQGTAALMPQFGPEDPDPLPSLSSPRGQPIYFASAPGTTIQLSSYAVTLVGGTDVTVVQVNQGNDVHKLLKSHEFFIVPVKPLNDNSTYQVTAKGTSSGRVSATNPTGEFTTNFTFKTGTFYSQ